MDEDREALERVERRVAQLERIVQQLAERVMPPAGPRSVLPAALTPAAPAPSIPRPRPERARMFKEIAPPSAGGGDIEQWVGQRGLLAVGIIALLATAGFFLKYAIEQGWISPWLRVNGGVLAGVAVAIWGDRLATRGLRAYGAALVGAGGGLAYLAAWAAAAPYGLVSRPLGMAVLVGLAVAVAARAVRHRVEALAGWAVAGAYLAPFFIPSPHPDFAVLLAYLFVVGGGSAWLAQRMRWRGAFDFALAGYFLIPALLVGSRLPLSPYAAYLAVGGVAALVATQFRSWPEARLAALMLPWLSLIPLSWSAESDALRWLILTAGVALALTVWLHHCTVDPIGRNDPAEMIVFLASPMALLLLSAWAPEALRDRWAVIPAVLAALYLAVGWPRRAAPLVGMSLGLVAVAIADAGDSAAVVALGWAAMGLFAVAADRWLEQRVGRGAGLWLIGLGVLVLFGGSLGRDADDPAFTGRWSLAWYGCTACAALGARWWQTRDEDAPWLRSGATVLWAIAGAAIFAGGSQELDRFFTAPLAGDLAISAFWILYAGVLVRLGFWLGLQPVRSAGLGMAGLAAAKIALYDLANLEALYRVASFFVLAVMTLAVAYAYNRRAKGVERKGVES